MAGELRRNPITAVSVLVSPEREKPLEQLRRAIPRQWPPHKIEPTILSGEECPFEVGHEHMTPPEFRSYRTTGTLENTPGWWVRAFPNKFPAFDPAIPSELLPVRKRGPYTAKGAYGLHYVIVESPFHNESLASVPIGQVREVLHMLRDLTHSTGSFRNIVYVLLFENYGPLAGASQPHPHSQLVGLPDVPPKINTELRGAERYREEVGKCFYCEEKEWELSERERLVEETERFYAWCPYTSETPYQATIAPKEHQSYFANIATYPAGTDALGEFAGLLQRTLRRLKKVLNDPDYSQYVHAGPTDQPEMPAFHWHVHIEPITEAIQAGLEKGSGVFINPRSPEKCAEDLRRAEIENL